MKRDLLVILLYDSIAFFCYQCNYASLTREADPEHTAMQREKIDRQKHSIVTHTILE